jgi:hypothetical protein
MKGAEAGDKAREIVINYFMEGFLCHNKRFGLYHKSKRKLSTF